MKDATLKQAKKVLEVFEETSLEKLQAIFGTGVLADLRDCDPSRITPDVRNAIRALMGLDLIQSKARNDFLRLISGGESIVIDATDGKEILANANNLFAHIDSDFKNWRADEPGQPTAEMTVDVYEMRKDATFEQMFGSLGADRHQLCLTQAQIKGFVKVKKYRNWLRADGYGTFFLFESYGQFFVALVVVDSGGRLEVDVCRLEYSVVWDAGYRLRLVVPRLA